MGKSLALKVFLLIYFFITYSASYAQNVATDATIQPSSLDSALSVYHRTLYPETGLYNGSEYAYNAYYPFVINEGNPFFISKDFSVGSVFYNNVLYENVPLLFDIIKEEVLIRDLSKMYIMRLNNDNINWFKIWGHSFVHLKQDSGTNSPVHTGFYDELYKGNVSLYKKVSKIFKENTASAQGVNKYVVENNEYFIKKNGQYFRIKNKKSMLFVIDDKQKQVQQFIRKNRLKFKKNKDDSFAKAVAFYDGINK